CRERKVRCSGLCPCTNCVRRSAECVFDQEDRKVLVSERHVPTHRFARLLNQLKRKVELAERDSSPSSRKRKQKESNDTRNCEQYIESNDERGEDILPRMRNPLTTTAAKFVTDPQGRRPVLVAGQIPDRSNDIGFLGPSSTWAYGRQVMSMIREYLNQDVSPLVPLNTNGQALTLEFPGEKQLGGTISMDNLPSLDYAIYLTNTVKFHISQTYHLTNRVSVTDFSLSMTMGRAH
ncbi:unnamed protein product, partial [Clonostachys chloroleuca]